MSHALTRACLFDSTRTEYIAHVVKLDVAESDRILHQLESDGYVTHQTREYDGEALWNTTLRCSLLAGASFLKPINRAKAEALLAGALDRTTSYNADPDMPVWIERVSLFGSLLDQTVTDFSDINLHAVLEDRAEHDIAEAARACARASGRNFPNWIDKLFWGQTETSRSSGSADSCHRRSTGLRHLPAPRQPRTPGGRAR